MSEIKTAKIYILPIGKLIHQAEFERAYWHLTVPNDVTVADLLKPGAWQHYPATLKAPALIDVMSEDMAMDIQLRVLGTDVGMVHVRLRAAFQLREGEAETDDEAPDLEVPELPEGYRVAFTPRNQYYAQLTMGPGDKQIVSSGHPNKALAALAAIEHARKSGRIEKAA